MVTPTRIPLAYAPQPLPGEALDGWLEHIAYGMGCSPAKIRTQLGIPIQRAYDLLRGLTEAQAAGISEATGVPPQRLCDMTLTYYQRWGLTPHLEKRGHGTGTWARGSGARYCPACLREQDMRWQLSWYLQWTVVCLKHHILLEDRCPACGRTVRIQPSGHPRTLASPTPAPQGSRDDRPAAGARECPCRVEWLAAVDHNESSVVGTAALAPVIAAQQRIKDVLEGSEAVPVTSFGTTITARHWLNDVAALTRGILTWLPPAGIPAVFHDWVQPLCTPNSTGPVSPATPPERIMRPQPPQAAASHGSAGSAGEQSAEPRHLELEATTDEVAPITAMFAALAPRLGLTAMVSPAKRLGEGTRSVPAIAFAMTAAIGLLSCPDVATGHAIVEDAKQARVVPRLVRSRLGEDTSWPLHRVFANPGTRRVRVNHLAARLRAARYLTDGQPRVPLVDARVSAGLWTPFTAAHPHSFSNNDHAPAAAAAALLTIGSSVSLNDAMHRLGLAHLGGQVARDIARVLRIDSDLDADVIDDLLALHQALTAGPVPIDYTRRRRIFSQTVLPSQRALRRFATAHRLRPTTRLGRHMSWYVYELLTGNDILVSPSVIDMHGPARSAYRRQREEWNQQPPPELLLRAEKALLTHRLDEPITWTPQRTTQGTWHCPSPDLTRQYNGWARRPARTHSLERVRLDGFDAATIVATALAAQTSQAAALAIRLARFAAVAHTNTNEAARRCDLSQPAITSTLQRLERDVGQPLFDRHSGRLVLTPHGRSLLLAIANSPLAHLDPGTRLTQAGRSS